MRFNGKPVVAHGDGWIEVDEGNGTTAICRGYNEALVERDPTDRDPDEEFRAAVQSAATLADLKAALLGHRGPGAQPRRR